MAQQKDYSLFFEHIGYKKYKDNKGRIILELPISEDILAEDGSIPSGVFSSMLDIVIGSTIADAFGKPTTTINLNMTFFDLTNQGPYTSSATITHRERKIITGEGIVVDQDHNKVAKGIGTFKVISA